MKIRINTISGFDKPSDEHVIFDVLEDVELSNYMLIDTLRTHQGITLKRNRTVYVFPHKKVKKGDRVFLYTTKGTDGERTPLFHNTQHIFYWNLNRRIWRRHIGKILLLHIEGYESKQLTVYS